MSDEYEPDTPIMSVETPSLTGTPTALTGSEASLATPDGSGEYNFITGPDGQTYAVMKEPFVWKKFFIGLGIPLFLMVVPIILASIAEGMDPWDYEDYESDDLYVPLVNDTAYAIAYTPDPQRELEWCYVPPNPENMDYECRSEENSMTMYVATKRTVSLISGNDTSYYANFSIDTDNQEIQYCDFQFTPSERDSWTFCEYHRTPSSHLHIIKETWDGDYRESEVGQWNETSGMIEYDDGEDHGSQIQMFIVIHEEVGHWTEDEGVLYFDSGVDHGDTIRIEVETISIGSREEAENTQATMDVLLGISWIMCLAAPLLSIVMIVYGFAVSGAKAMGIGASVALASYPIIGFFGCIAIMSGAW
jgi:hypothetical protein